MLTNTDRELLATCRALCGPPGQDWNIPFMAKQCRDHMPRVLEIIARLEADSARLAEIEAVWKGERQ